MGLTVSCGPTTGEQPATLLQECWRELNAELVRQAEQEAAERWVDGRPRLWKELMQPAALAYTEAYTAILKKSM